MVGGGAPLANSYFRSRQSSLAGRAAGEKVGRPKGHANEDAGSLRE